MGDKSPKNKEKRKKKTDDKKKPIMPTSTVKAIDPKKQSIQTGNSGSMTLVVGSPGFMEIFKRCLHRSV